MIREVDPEHPISLDDYEAVAPLGSAVRELRQEAEALVPVLRGRRVWMLNSTARGGGVAELLPPLLAILRELGVDARWLVMEPSEAEFFRLTKHVHNLIHGEGQPAIPQGDSELYRGVSRETAESLSRFVEAGDVLVVHDPQPLGAGAMLREHLDVLAIWRCHIGLDRETTATEVAWEFLCEYATPYDHAVFTAPEYIPRCFAGRAAIIHPAVDPLSHKNRVLPIHKLVGILANGGLIRPAGPVLTPPFPDRAQRLQRDGSWASACESDDIGLLYRPIVTQISRWDRLKGFLPLMQAFALLKQELPTRGDLDERDRRTLETARLVLAGPEAASVQDDPEAKEVLAEISAAYLDLTDELQESIAIVTLPMTSAKHNALLVNALQRCSDIVVQNSIHEGFGLTVTEAMWKHIAVVGTRAAGIRQQIRPDMDGLLVGEPENPGEIARTLDTLLRDQPRREAMGRSAEQRVYSEFLVFTQVRRWLELIGDSIDARWG